MDDSYLKMHQKSTGNSRSAAHWPFEALPMAWRKGWRWREKGVRYYSWVFFQWLHRQSPASLLWFGVLDTVCLMTTWPLPEAKSTFVIFYLYNDMFADPLTNSYVLECWPQLLGGWEDRSVFDVGMLRIWPVPMDTMPAASPCSCQRLGGILAEFTELLDEYMI